jgi:hypothetical protein
MSEESFKPILAPADISANNIVLTERALLTATDQIPLHLQLVLARILEMSERVSAEASCNLNVGVVCLFFALEQADSAVRSKITELALSAPLQVQGPLKNVLLKAARILQEVSNDKQSEIKAILNFFQLYFIAVPGRNGSQTYAIFEVASVRIPHSCSPNCLMSLAVAEGTLISEIYSVKSIKTNEILTASHLPFQMLRAPRTQRQRILLAVRGFDCKCSACVGPDMMRRLPCSVCSKEARCFMSEQNGLWSGSVCGERRADPPVSEDVEMKIVKKLHIVQSLETESLDKVMAIAGPVLATAADVLGKKHHAYQQALSLVIVKCVNDLVKAASDGAADASQTNLSPTTTMTPRASETAEPSQQANILSDLVDLVEETISYGLETDLPFMGLDELASIIMSPGVLESAAVVARQGEADITRRFESILLLCVGAVQSFQDPQQSAIAGNLLQSWFKLKKPKMPVEQVEPTADEPARANVEVKAKSQKETTASKWAFALTVCAAIATAGLLTWRRRK